MQAPGQVQRGSGEGSGEGLGNRVPEKLPEKVPGSLGASQVRFNRVPEKVPEKVGEALVQSQGKFNRVWRRFRRRFRRRLREVFNRVPEKVPQKVPEKVWEAFVQSQVMFNRVPERFRRRSAMGGFGAELQQGSEEGSGRLWCRARSGSEVGAKPSQVQRVWDKVPKAWEALVQSQVKFNKVSEKVPEKVCNGRLWCRTSTGFRRRFREALVQSQVRFRSWCKAKSGSTGLG